MEELEEEGKFEEHNLWGREEYPCYPLLCMALGITGGILWPSKLHTWNDFLGLLKWPYLQEHRTWATWSWCPFPMVLPMTDGGCGWENECLATLSQVLISVGLICSPKRSGCRHPSRKLPENSPLLSFFPLALCFSLSHFLICFILLKAFL
jgi:hypothetical protein